MLLLWLVESDSFKEFINYIDPSFNIPTRKTVKNTGISSLKEMVLVKLRDNLKNVEFPNMSVGGLSDATVRSFYCYVCQGIDTDWKLVT
jgi:hypothetical protein